jgi:hypothetical protein
MPTAAWGEDPAACVRHGSMRALCPDGTAIAARLTGERLARANQHVIVLDWLEELGRLVPAS